MIIGIAYPKNGNHNPGGDEPASCVFFFPDHIWKKKVLQLDTWVFHKKHVSKAAA